MTVKGRVPQKPQRSAARTHHISVTQPIMAMGMACARARLGACSPGRVQVRADERARARSAPCPG